MSLPAFRHAVEASLSALLSSSLSKEAAAAERMAALEGGLASLAAAAAAAQKALADATSKGENDAGQGAAWGNLQLTPQPASPHDFQPPSNLTINSTK